MIHSMQHNTQKKNGEVALKIDISKAYDRLNWSFLRQMLSALGFPTRWIKMIMMTVESVNYFVKVKEILFPRIFLSFAWKASRPTWIAKNRRGAFTDAKRLGAPPISHIFFADDAFFFCKASIDEIRHLKFMLTKYEDALGQGINYAKSGIMGSKNLASDLMQGFSHILGIFKPINIGRYLGLPSLVGRSKKSIFHHIRDKLWTKLQN